MRVAGIAQFARARGVPFASGASGRAAASAGNSSERRSAPPSSDDASRELSLRAHISNRSELAPATHSRTPLHTPCRRALANAALFTNSSVGYGAAIAASGANGGGGGGSRRRGGGGSQSGSHSGAPPAKLFVGGVPGHAATESEIRQLFERFGPVREVFSAAAQ